MTASAHFRCLFYGLVLAGLMGGGLASAQEGGPYPTGLPSYAQPATALLPPADSSGRRVTTL